MDPHLLSILDLAGERITRLENRVRWLSIAVIVFGINFLIYSCTAKAASPEICRPYAAQTAQTLMNFVWLRAYTECLNEDEARPAPEDWYNAMCVVLPGCEFATPGSVPAVDEPKKKVYRKKRKHRR